MLRQYGKKCLTMFLALCMVLGMLPAGALAAEAENGSSLIVSNGETRYFDGNGSPAKPDSKDWQVSTSKMAEETGRENEYKITLNVTTKTKIVEVEEAQGADVVLVLDASTSMDYLVVNGKTYNPNDTGWFGQSKDWEQHHAQGYTTRWEKMKAAAAVFIRSLLAEGKDNRVAIVIYGGNQSNGTINGTAQSPASHRVLAGDNGYWFTSADNACAKINYPAVAQATIDNQPALSGTSLRNAYLDDGDNDQGATNSQAGFWGAEYALKTARDNVLPCTVFMSDGAATRRYSDKKNSTGNLVTNVTSDHWARNADNSSSTAATTQLAQMQKNTGALVYGLAFDVAADSGVFGKIDADKRFAYNSQNGQTVLDEIMKTITKQIELAVEPWTVEDPMTAWVDLDGNSIKNDYVTVAPDGSSFKWDLAAANAAQDYQYDSAKGTYTFTMSYVVKVDPESISSWVDEDGNYTGAKATNGATGLSFRLSIDGVAQPPAYAPFVVPTIDANLYKVNFYDHDSKPLKEESVLYGGTATPPNDPVHEGLRFDGWDGTYENVTQSEDVYAKCVPNTYSVTYYVDGESVLAIPDVQGGTAFNTLETPKNPVKDSTAQYDYTFTGWKAADAYYGDTVTQDRRYDAQFDSVTRSYTVTFLDKDGGQLSQKTYEYGANIQYIPKAPVVADTDYASYEFAGWAAPQDKTYTTGDQVKEDMTFTATYTKTGKSYTITTSGDAGVESITPTQSYPAGSAPTIEWTLKDGYELVNVDTDQGNTGSGKVTFHDLTSDDHVSVTTRLKEYTVVFKARTDSGTTEEIFNTVVKHGTSVSEPTDGFVQSYVVETKGQVQVGVDENGDPVYEEQVIRTDTYTFTAWEGDSGATMADLDYVSRDMTFTAQYGKETESKHLVRFLAENESTVISAKYYDEAAVIKVPEGPAKASTDEFDYRFSGWVPQGIYKLDTPVAGAMDFVAGYEATKRTYGVTFLVTGGPNSQVQVGDVQQIPYGGNAVLPEYTLPEGYHFTSEWSGNYQNIVKAETVVRTIERNEYTVKFYVDDPDMIGAALKEQTVLHGNAATAPQVTPGEGRKFNNNWSPAYNSVKGNLNVFATTSPITYTVQFQKEDGTPQQTLNPEHGSDVSGQIPAGPAKASTDTYRYEFSGWVPASADYTLENLDSVTQSMYFKASYKEIQIPYSVTYLDESGNAIPGLGRADYKYGDTMDAHPAGPVKADTAQFHYAFDQWVAENSDYQDAVTVERSMVFKARYTETTRTYKVAVTIDDGTAQGGGTFSYGDDVTVSWLPAAGYHVTGVTRNGAQLTAGETSYTEKALAEDVTIHVSTTKNIYTVKFLLDDGVTVYQSGSVEHGGSYQLPANPTKAADAGYSYTFKEWVPTSDKSSLEMLSSVPHDLTFKASFASTAHTYSFAVNYEVQEDADNIPADVDYIKSMSRQESRNVGEDAAAEPLTTVPPDYKLINSSANSEKVSFDDAKKATATGAGKGDKLVVTYTYGLKSKAAVNVNYVLTDGTKDENGRYVALKTLGSESLSYRENDPYDVTEKVLAFDGAHAMYARLADSDALTGKLSGTETATVNVYYTANLYDFTVKYHNDYTNTEIVPAEGMTVTAKAPYGAALDELTVARLLENKDWVNAMKPSGYNSGTFAVITVGEKGDENIVTVHYGYTTSGGGDSGPSNHSVTVRYKETGTNKVLADPYTSTLSSGSSYDVSAQADLAISGYTIDRVEGSVSGRLTRDVTVTVWYTAETETDIEEPEIPLGPNPDDTTGTTPGGDGEVDITDPDIPMSDLPFEGSDGDGTIIVDGEIPMGNLPQTGTLRAGGGTEAALSSIAFGAAMAAAGLAFVVGRKKEEER